MKADAVIEYRKTNKFKSNKDFKNINGTYYKTQESLKRGMSVSKENTPIVKQKASKKINEAKDK